MILERFFSAAESIAFPLPQGFSAFFSYLGYHALDFKTFLQYVDHNVFELQIDVLNSIFKGLCIDSSKHLEIFDSKYIKIFFSIAIGGESEKTAEKKHLILSKVPRSRAYRILKNLNDSRTLRVLGRDHANSILSGVSSANTRKNSKAISIGMTFLDQFISFHCIHFIFLHAHFILRLHYFWTFTFILK